MHGTEINTDTAEPNYVVWEKKREVAWMERGDPFGFPVFYAHGNPGSRLELLFLDQKARQYGFRLIVFERPGFGKSDYIEGYPLLAFAQDLKRLADKLAIQYFGLIGWSSGGPPVFAAAYHVPARVRFVFSIAGYTNFGEFCDAKRLMAGYDLYGSALMENRFWLLNGLARFARWTDLHLPNFYFKMARGDMTAPDRRILDDPEIAELFMRNQQEALAPGIEGAIQDLETQWAPWEFSLTEIRAPAHIFQGRQDAFVPPEFAEHMSCRIPEAELHMYPDWGHLFVLRPCFQDELFCLARRFTQNR